MKPAEDAESTNKQQMEENQQLKDQILWQKRELEKYAKHKIKSATGPLDMRLIQVPKMLSVLRKEWAPSAFYISFKLETDPDILLQKADSAMNKYKMHVVMANLLATYKKEVIAVTRNGKSMIPKSLRHHKCS